MPQTEQAKVDATATTVASEQPEHIPGIEDIRRILDEMELDVAKFRAGQKACASRIRQGLQRIKEISHQTRKEISEIIQARGGW